jgi:hypothetical protein
MAEAPDVKTIDIEPNLTRTDVFELIDHTAKTLRRIQRMTIYESGLTPPGEDSAADTTHDDL